MASRKQADMERGGDGGGQGQKRKYEKLRFISSDIRAAKEAAQRLEKRYGSVPLEEADAVVALGGDGLMLATLHRTMKHAIPIYGMHQGSIGFLMNEYDEEDLPARLARAEINIIHPLQMDVLDCNGERSTALAINEVSLYRQRYQAAKLRLFIDGKMRLDTLICDGVLVATPAGSTAYNLSAHGPILPINARLLALTPISPFCPRRWRGAILSDNAQVRIEVMEAQKRPVSAVADHSEIRHVREVEITARKDMELKLMFDPGHALDERILSEQFTY
jgi:NAD+ kinase